MLPIREETYQEYEHLIKNENTATIECLVQHWNNLPEDLKQGEPHSLPNFRAAIQRAPKVHPFGKGEEQ